MFYLLFSIYKLILSLCYLNNSSVVLGPVIEEYLWSRFSCREVNQLLETVGFSFKAYWEIIVKEAECRLHSMWPIGRVLYGRTNSQRQGSDSCCRAWVNIPHIFYIYVKYGDIWCLSSYDFLIYFETQKLYSSDDIIWNISRPIEI
jgi:hypothetical protein